MKIVWVVNYRNDAYSENDIYIYENKEDAVDFFKEIVKENKNENEFDYEDGDDTATWERGGYFCGTCYFEKEMR